MQISAPHKLSWLRTYRESLKNFWKIHVLCLRAGPTGNAKVAPSSSLLHPASAASGVTLSSGKAAQATFIKLKLPYNDAVSKCDTASQLVRSLAGKDQISECWPAD